MNALTSRGKALAETGEYDKAIADFDQALRLNPQLVDALYCRGLARCFKKEYDKAIADFERPPPGSIRIMPRSTATAAVAVWLSTHDMDKAAKDFLEADRREPRLADRVDRDPLASRPQLVGPAPSMPCWSRREAPEPSATSVRTSSATGNPPTSAPQAPCGPSRRGQPHRCLGGQGGGRRGCRQLP